MFLLKQFFVQIPEMRKTTGCCIQRSTKNISCINKISSMPNEIRHLEKLEIFSLQLDRDHSLLELKIKQLFVEINVINIKNQASFYF